MSTFSTRQWATPTVQSQSTRPAPTAKAHSGANLKTAQRHTVRLALLSIAVIAALIGAQALALLDNSVQVQPSQAANVSQIDPNQ